MFTSKYTMGEALAEVTWYNLRNKIIFENWMELNYITAASHTYEDEKMFTLYSPRNSTQIQIDVVSYEQGDWILLMWKGDPTWIIYYCSESFHSGLVPTMDSIPVPYHMYDNNFNYMLHYLYTRGYSAGNPGFQHSQLPQEMPDRFRQLVLPEWSPTSPRAQPLVELDVDETRDEDNQSVGSGRSSPILYVFNNDIVQNAEGSEGPTRTPSPMENAEESDSSIRTRSPIDYDDDRSSVNSEPLRSSSTNSAVF